MWEPFAFVGKTEEYIYRNTEGHNIFKPLYPSRIKKDARPARHGKTLRDRLRKYKKQALINQVSI